MAGEREQEKQPLLELTPEHRSLMGSLATKWIDFSTGGDTDLDAKAATQGVEWLYEAAGLPRPQVWVTDSPFGAQIISKGLQRDHQRHNLTPPQAVQETLSYTGVSLLKDDRLETYVSPQVQQQIEAGTYHAVSERLWPSLWSNLSGAVEADVLAQKRYPNAWAGETLMGRADEMAYYDFFQALGVPMREEVGLYRQYLESGVFTGVMLSNLAVLSRRPSVVRTDDRDQPHSSEQAAVEFPDGYKAYAIHGEFYPKAKWSKLVQDDNYTSAEAIIEVETFSRMMNYRLEAFGFNNEIAWDDQED